MQRELPNEFEDFPSITQFSFPDKFPIPVGKETFNGSSMMDLATRRHLLDLYDGRFCDQQFLFWLSSIITRHTTIKNTSSFYKMSGGIKTRRKFDALLNDPDLTRKLGEAIKDDTSLNAKQLNSSSQISYI